jgi:hypothetical protein
MRRRVLTILLVLFVLPLLAHGVVFAARGWPETWSTADWTSAGIAPTAVSTPEAVVQVWAGRTGRWKGIFATHSWLVIKGPGEARWRRYDKVGWGIPVRRDIYAPDARWYSNEPFVIAELRGRDAEAALPAIEAAIARYPYRAPGEYRAWPGPNSNTFVQYVIAGVPALAGAMPSTAVGKDYRVDGALIGLSPSRTGVQLSLWGLAGVTVGWIDGVEMNVLGLVAGIDLRRPALKLPGIGRVGMKPV